MAVDHNNIGFLNEAVIANKGFYDDFKLKAVGCYGLYKNISVLFQNSGLGSIIIVIVINYNWAFVCVIEGIIVINGNMSIIIVIIIVIVFHKYA